MSPCISSPCICCQIQCDLRKFITDTLKSLSRQIGYFQDPKDQITQMTDAMDKLRAKRKDLINRIRKAQHAREVPTHQFLDWFGKVSVMDDKVKRILDKHEKGSFRWCTNRRAAHILPDVMALYENFVDKYHKHDLTIMLPLSQMKNIWSCNSHVQVVGDPVELHDHDFVLDTNLSKQKDVVEDGDAIWSCKVEDPVELHDQGFVLDTYLSKLEDAVEDGESRIIGIWGIGGVGKTTLLSSLNNKLYGLSKAGQSKRIFDYVIWAVVSKDYMLGKLQRNISEQLGLPLYNGDRVTQAREIMGFLKNKTFLLLLDDLWDPVDLAELGIPHPFRTRATKQKVVFTTRFEDVCVQMQARPKIEIQCLEEAEAWQLFQDKVSEETLQADVRIPQLARQVAQECDGHPLSLVVIGSAMSTKKTLIEWKNAINQLQKSKQNDIYGIDDMFFLMLKFSYDNLADEILRKSFLLCSLWPEDYSISKTDLIECWMGHGLIDECKFDNINEAYDSGYSFIGMLQAACLLEPGDNNERAVKMHRMVRDLALWIASDYGKKSNRFIVNPSVIPSNDSQREMERISFVNKDIIDTSLCRANYLVLETLIVQKSFSFKSIVPGFFEGTRALTYLDLSFTGIRNLPEEIDLLCNLRYLNLSCTWISFLSSKLGSLRNLRFLLLRELNNIIIAGVMWEKLEMLSVIDMTNTWCDNWHEILRLSVYLKGVGIVLQSIRDLQQLAKLPNVLIWRLVLRGLQGLNEPLELLSPLQLGSCNIRSSIQMLKIEDSESLEVVSMESDGGENWCLLRLEELELKSLPKLKYIVWRGVSPMKMLPSLTVLTIYECDNLSNISWLIRLPNLEHLTVRNCSDVKQIIDDYSEFVGFDDEENDVVMAGPAFPSLRRLELCNLKSLRMFGGSYTFPSLELLQVVECPEMKTLPFGSEIAGEKLKKISGLREWWEKLKMEDNMRAKLVHYFREI